jgi:hypothetical protein
MTTRFYFHLVRGSERIIDRAGMTLPRAAVMSPQILERVKERWPGTTDVGDWEDWSVEIADAAGNIVRTIALV